jgi:hypothetical protein
LTSDDIDQGSTNQFLSTEKVTLSAAQILSSNTSPVELLPAPGVGKVILVFDIIAFYDYGTTTYNGSIYSVVKFSSASI